MGVVDRGHPLLGARRVERGDVGNGVEGLNGGGWGAGAIGVSE